MNVRRFLNSIVTRVTLLGVVIILAGTAARFVAITALLREDIAKLASSQQLALATYVAHDIDHKVNEREQLLRRLAHTLPPELLTRQDELRAWLARQHELLPLFSYGLFVADTTGRSIADYPQRIERERINYSERDYFRAAMAGTPYIGRPVIGLAAREPVLPMGEPVRDDKGTVVAVLVGVTTLGAPGFLDLLQSSRIGDAGSFLLISPRDRLFVGAGDPDLVLKPTPPPGVNPLHDRAMAGYRGTGITVNAKGVEELSAMVSVPSTGWFVVARLPTSEAFAPLTRAQSVILKVSIPAILLLIAIGWTILRVTFRPLFNAARHADRMTRGEAPLEPLPIARDDEVGHLTAAFNRLLLKLSDSQAELDRMAHHDLLTGLPNRLLLSDRLHQALERARRHDLRLAVLCLDLDGFKPVNDTMGHEAGDEALRQVAKRFSETVRSSDTLARLGGDEFIIVLTDMPAADAHRAACAVAEKCIAAISHPLRIGDAICSLGVSVGIVVGNGHCRDRSLMQAADRAMYRAKEAGRNRYVIGDDLDCASIDADDDFGLRKA